MNPEEKSAHKILKLRYGNKCTFAEVILANIPH